MGVLNNKEKDVIEISRYKEIEIDNEDLFSGGISAESELYHKKCFDSVFKKS
jgi:hypothetical protein